jgi:serine/threonine-protein kinase RsbW
VGGSDGRPGQIDGLVLSLRAEPGEIPAARHAVASYCVGHGLPSPLIDDIKLVVTEACTNVVLHAYEGVATRPHTFELTALIDDGTLTVSVADHGRGIGPPSVNRGLGLGLRLALQLAGGVHTREGDDGHGTRLTMRFDIPDQA